MSIQANINLISIDADGAITEYNAQILLMQGNETHEFLTYDNMIHDVHFQAPIYSGKPIIRIQDPKHAKKNGRNAIHSGARLLVLGSDTVRYDQIYQLVQEENSALYIRDVINVDTGLHIEFFLQIFWLNVKIMAVWILKKWLYLSIFLFLVSN